MAAWTWASMRPGISVRPGGVKHRDIVTRRQVSSAFRDLHDPVAFDPDGGAWPALAGYNVEEMGVADDDAGHVFS